VTVLGGRWIRPGEHDVFDPDDLSEGRRVPVSSTSLIPFQPADLIHESYRSHSLLRQPMRDSDSWSLSTLLITFWAYFVHHLR